MEIDWSENEFHKASIQYWVSMTDDRYRPMYHAAERMLGEAWGEMARQHNFFVTMAKTVRVVSKVLLDKPPE